MTQASNPALVYLIDDDASVRAALADLLASVGLDARTFASTREFLAHWQQSPPQPFAPPQAACMVLDIRMPEQSGLEFQRQMQALDIHLPVIFITAHGDVPMSVQAMKAGAIEFLTKPFREQELLDAIQHGLELNRQHRARAAQTQQLRERWQSLTEGEKAVALGVINGQLNKQIAFDLGVSEITVKVRRANSLRKMQVRNTVDLVRVMERLGQEK